MAYLKRFRLFNMKRLIKIAHIQLLPLLTGVQRVSLDELVRLDRNMFETYMICQSDGLLINECKKNGIKYIFNRFLRREISPVYDILAFVVLYIYFRKYKFDIVHTHSSKTGVIGRLAARLAGVPMIVHTVHGFSFPAAKNKYERTLFFLMEWIGTKCSHQIICLHEDDQDIVINKLGAKKSNVVVIPNGVDVERFSLPTDIEKINMKMKFVLDQSNIVVGMVGRLWHQKNPHMLLRAALNILEFRTDVHFVFVGDGDLRHELENQIFHSGKQANFHFAGWHSNPEYILKMFDVFVLPSLWEGMPLAILEAQATGLPCVVSNIPGNRHLVFDNINGFVFDLDDIENLVDKLLILISDSKVRDLMGLRAIEFIKKNHNINIRVKSIASSYLNKLGCI